MKIHAIASAALVAACFTPLAATEESPPEEAPGKAPAEARGGAPCSPEQPCALPFVEAARRRVALEAENEARVAKAGESAATKKVAEAWIQGLARSIDEERGLFSKWCETIQGLAADKRRAGARGLTKEDLLSRTGQPPRESKVESADGSVDGTSWAWDAEGAISHSVSFALLFMRPAGTKDPWVFGGCQWCASGGPATTRGCVMVP